MPTQKPMYSIVVDEKLLEKIDNFRFGNRYKSRSAATVSLIEIAMKTLEGEESIQEEEKKPALSEQEEELLTIFQELDERKKEELLDFARYKQGQRYAAR